MLEAQGQLQPQHHTKYCVPSVYSPYSFCNTSFLFPWTHSHSLIVYFFRVRCFEMLLNIYFCFYFKACAYGGQRSTLIILCYCSAPTFFETGRLIKPWTHWLGKTSHPVNSRGSPFFASTVLSLQNYISQCMVCMWALEVHLLAW